MSRVLSLAGFEVTLIGRFWVIPEEIGVATKRSNTVRFCLQSARAHTASLPRKRVRPSPRSCRERRDTAFLALTNLSAAAAPLSFCSLPSPPSHAGSDGRLRLFFAPGKTGPLARGRARFFAYGPFLLLGQLFVVAVLIRNIPSGQDF